MKNSLKSKAEGINSVDTTDTHFPELMQKAASIVVSSMHTNTYDKHEYKKMIYIYMCAPKYRTKIVTIKTVKKI